MFGSERKGDKLMPDCEAAAIDRRMPMACPTQVPAVPAAFKLPHTASASEAAPSEASVPEQPAVERPAPPSQPLRENRAAVLSLAVFAIIAVVVLCWNYLPQVYAWVSDADAVRAYVGAHPVLSRLALMGVNVLQIVLAFLPGEPVELAAGYAFGFWEGTALCLVASAVGSSVIFFAVRRWGRSLIGVFFDQGKLDEFSWLQRTARLELVMFVIFLIPGTPKDFLTYFAGLTRMRWVHMLAIVSVGRIPSIVTSTVAADAFSQGAYGVVAFAVGIMLLPAAAGGGIYAWYVRREKRRAA